MGRRPKIDIGYLEVPKDYLKLSKEDRLIICDHLIDSFIKQLDGSLNPNINRINFLEEILDASIQSNEDLENYEICVVLSDCKNRLNEE
jgi:hypothetical protein